MESIKQRFAQLVVALSPENLHADGEVTPAVARARRNKIMKEWADLENKYGSSVTESQAWDWAINPTRT